MKTPAGSRSPHASAGQSGSVISKCRQNRHQGRDNKRAGRRNCSDKFRGRLMVKKHVCQAVHSGRNGSPSSFSGCYVSNGHLVEAMSYFTAARRVSLSSTGSPGKLMQLPSSIKILM
jgi:hypothetical protein